MRFWGRVVIAGAMLGLAGAPALAQAPQAASVIVLNYNALIANSIGGRDLTTKLQQIGAAMSQELQPEAQGIETERQRLNQATQNMTEEQVRANAALVQQAQALQQRVQAFETRRVTAARDLECTELMARNRFNELITPLVRQVMTERGAGIVLDRAAANLVLTDYDATSRVLALIDQSVRTVEVSRLSASACEAPAAAAAPAPAEQPQQGRRRRNNNDN